jgi:hypothetical protein
MLAAACLAPLPAAAVVVENLYRADIEVEDHSARVLQKATRAGLAQVLVKVSGSREVLKNADVKRGLRDNRRYLQRYQYHRLETGELNLQIQYDSQLVTELLTLGQQPLWTANRRPVLVWLVVNDGSGRHFATAETDPELQASLQMAMQRRGVPAVFPLLDLEDTLEVSIDGLWALNPLAIYRASQRYDLGSILVGRLSAMADGRWMGDWLYLQEGEKSASSFYGKDSVPLSDGVIDTVAAHMADRYAVAAGTSLDEDVFIRVDNLTDYGAYREVVEYLEGIELIDSAYPAYIEGSTMVFRLRAQAEAEQLHRIIALSRRLQRLQGAVPLDAGGGLAQLVYRWNP